MINNHRKHAQWQDTIILYYKMAHQFADMIRLMGTAGQYHVPQVDQAKLTHHSMHPPITHIRTFSLLYSNLVSSQMTLSHFSSSCLYWR